MKTKPFNMRHDLKSGNQAVSIKPFLTNAYWSSASTSSSSLLSSSLPSLQLSDNFSFFVALMHIGPCLATPAIVLAVGNILPNELMGQTFCPILLTNSNGTKFPCFRPVFCKMHCQPRISKYKLKYLVLYRY